MPKRQPIEIALPHLKPVVSLPTGLAQTLSLVIQAGESGISSLELLNVFPMTTRENISQLRKIGAIIHTERKPAVGKNGRLHKGVAHYTYRGWH